MTETMAEMKTMQGILALVDVVNFTGQAARLGDKYTASYTEYFQEKIRKIVSSHGFQVIKSMGDAILFFGTDPAALLEIMLDLFQRDKPENRHGFTSKFRLVAHSGFFQFQVENEKPVDLVSPDGIKVFRLEKLAQSWELVVTQPLYQGIKALLTDKGVEATRLVFNEPLKGFDSEEWLPPFFRLKIAEPQTGAANLLERKLAELEQDVRLIPVFGNIYQSVPMEKNFINLCLVCTDERYLSNFERLSRPADDIDSLEAGKRKRGRKGEGPFPELDRELPDEIYRIDVPGLYEKFSKAIIFGLPGAGKTTILRHLAYKEFKLNRRIKSDQKKRLILFVACKDAPLYDDWYRERHGAEPGEPGWEEALSFITWVFLFGNRKYSDLTPDQLVECQHAEQRVEKAFKEERLTLLIDALDEGGTIHIRQRLKQLFYALYSKNRLYLTSRPSEEIHLKQEPGKEIPVFKVLNLDMEQVRALARHILNGDSPIYKKFDTALWQEEVVVRMAATPITALLITAYFQVYEKFDHRYPMYDLLVKFILLKAWEGLKSGTFPYHNMNLFFQEVGKPGFLATHKETRVLYDALAELCFEMFYASVDGSVQRSVNEETLIVYFTRFIQKRDHYRDEQSARAEAAQWKERFFRDHLLLQAGTREYVFVHSTIMEYLAAYYLVQAGEKDQKKLTELLHQCLGSEAFLELETVPLAAGSSLEKGFEILKVLKVIPVDYDRKHIYDQAVKCLAEVEWLLEKTLSGIRLRSLKTSIMDLVQGNRPALAWVYEYLKDLVLSEDKVMLNDSLLRFDLHVRLSRETLLVEYLNYKAFEQGDSELVSLRKKLLERLVQPRILEKWLETQEKEKLSRGNIAVYDHALQLDSIGYHPEDKNFAYYKNLIGPELIGFFGSPNLKHIGTVLCLAISPDGLFMADGANGTTIRYREVKTGKEVRVFKGHKGWVYSVAFSPDGRYLLSGSKDQTLRLWDVESGKDVRVFSGHDGPVKSVAFSPDGKYLVSGSEDKSLRLWERTTGKDVRVLQGNQFEFTCLAFSLDRKIFITGSENNTIIIWDFETGKEIRTLPGHSEIVKSVSLSPDGNILISGSKDGSIKWWDMKTGEEIRTIKTHLYSVESIAFVPNGKSFFTSGNDNTIKCWDLETGVEINTFSGHQRIVRSVDVSPDGKYLVSGSDDRTLRLWDRASGKELRVYEDHQGSVRSVAFSPDGKYLVSGSNDQTLRVWETGSGKQVRVFVGHGDWVTSVAFSPDGKYMASGSADQNLRLWDIETGKKLRTLAGHWGSVNSVAFSPDGQYLVSGSADQTLRFWKVKSGKEVRVFAGHGDRVWSVAFSPDDQYLVSGSADKTLRLWELKSGEEVWVFEGHNDVVLRVVFSPDEKKLISVSYDQTIKIWDINDGKCQTTITLPWWSNDIKPVPGQPGLYVTANGNGTLTLLDLSRHLGIKK